MPSGNAYDVLVNIEANVRDFQNQLNQVANRMNNLGGTSRRTGGIISQALSFAGGMGITNALTMAGSKILELGKKGIELASDLQEVQNVVDVTFGPEGSTKINEWSTQVLNSFGLSELMAKKFSSSMGAMLKSSGLAGDKVIEMSTNLTQLTGDMASFYNLGHEETWNKIRAGISGETEPLKQLGINMSVANLEAYALSKGINTSWKEMSQAQQVTLRYGYLMETTADAQGDFNRTQDGFANQLRLVTENLNDLIGRLAGPLLDPLARGLKATNDFVAGLSSSSGKFEKFKGYLTTINNYLMPKFREVFSYVNTNILPPLQKLFQYFVDNILPKFVNYFRENFPKVENTLKNLWTIAKVVIDSLVMAFEKAWPFISWLVENVVDNILRVLSNLWDIISGLTDFIAGLATGDWKLAWEGIKKVVLAVFDNLYGIIGDVGKNIVLGLVDGITSMKDYVFEKVSDVADTIASAFTDFFQISSPSKKTEGYGYDIIDGLAKGLLDDGAQNVVKKQSKKISDEMKKIAEDVAKNTENILEKSKTLADNTLNQAKDSLNKLYDATIYALNRKWDKEEKLQMDSLQVQEDMLRAHTEKQIREYDRELMARLKLLDDTTNSSIREIQNKIDAINNLTEEENKELDEQEYQNRLAQLNSEMLTEDSEERKLELVKRINELKLERQRKQLLEERNAKIEAYKKEIEDIKDKAVKESELIKEEFEGKKKQAQLEYEFNKASFDAEMKLTQDHYAKLREKEDEVARERYLKLGENNDELIALLQEYNPKWQDAGQTFGEKFLNGLNSTKQSITSAIDDIVNISTRLLKPALNNVIKQAGDLWWKARAIGSQELMDKAHNIAELARGSMPSYANGTNFATGGPSLVGERGPEIVNLPRGAKVTPNEAIGGIHISIGNLVGTGGMQELAQILSRQLNMKYTTAVGGGAF